MAKKRDKQERKILDSQERAFWDVYRPSPGQVNTTETDIKKMYKLSVIFGQEQALVGTEKTELSQLHRELAALQVLELGIVGMSELPKIQLILPPVLELV